VGGLISDFVAWAGFLEMLAGDAVAIADVMMVSRPYVIAGDYGRADAWFSGHAV
jgi:hypothetical protein